jgi:hypothetical protein
MNRSVPAPRSSFSFGGLFGAALVLALPSLARADDLFVGSPTTLIQRGNPYSGDFSTVGACGGQAQSMTLDGDRLLVGDPTGRIYQKLPSDNFVSFLFEVPNDAQALAMHAGNLLVGGSDGTILRVDAQSGAVLATLDVPVPVSALLVLGDDVYAGSSFGIVEKGNALTGGFQFWGTCGGPVNSLASDATALILGSSIGQIYRVNFATQQLEGNFAAGNDAEAIAIQDGDLVVAGSDGSIRRLVPTTGAFRGAFESAVPVSSLAVLPEAQPGVIYCYGGGCPCGNNDPDGGCAHSGGFGARLSGSGTASVAADDLRLFAFHMPLNRLSRFYMSQHTTMIPLGDGLLCAGGGGSGYPPLRFPAQSSGPAGSISLPEHIVAYNAQHFPNIGQILPGATWHSQVWYRDPAGPCGQHFNTSNSYAVTFVP